MKKLPKPRAFESLADLFNYELEFLTQKFSGANKAAQPNLIQIRRERLALYSGRVHALFDLLFILVKSSDTFHTTCFKYVEPFKQLCTDFRHLCSVQGVANQKRRRKVGKLYKAIYEIFSRYALPLEAEDEFITLIELFIDRRDTALEKLQSFYTLRLTDINGVLRDTLNRQKCITPENAGLVAKRIYSAAKLELREIILIDEIKAENCWLRKQLLQPSKPSSAVNAMIRHVLGEPFPEARLIRDDEDIQDCLKCMEDAPDHLKDQMDKVITHYEEYLDGQEKEQTL